MGPYSEPHGSLAGGEGPGDGSKEAETSVTVPIGLHRGGSGGLRCSSCDVMGGTFWRGHSF